MGLFDSMTPEGWLAFASQVAQPSATRGSPIGSLANAYMVGGQASNAAQQQAILRQKQQMEMEELQRVRAEQERGRQAMAEYRPSGATPFENLLNQARFFESKGMLKEAQQAMTMAEKFKPKFKTDIRTEIVDGKPVSVQYGEGGERQVVQGGTPYERPMEVNMGGSVGIFNPLTQSMGPTFDKTVTPDAQLQAGVSMRGQNMVDARSREANATGDTKKQAEAVTAVRKEINSLPPVQNYREALPVFNSAKTAPDTPAGDLDLIYAVGKVFDPNSVVREGEMALVIKAGTPMQRWEGTVRSIMAGKGRLTPSQRAQLMQTLQGRVNELKASSDRALTPYRAQIQSMNLPESQIFAAEPQVPASNPNDPLGLR